MKSNLAGQYARALFEATRGLTEKDTSKTVDAFVALVRRKGLGRQLARIADAYEQVELKREGRAPLLVETKHPLDARMKRKLRERFGEKREIAETIATEGKGGMRVKDGDTLYDATIGTQLKQLYEHLTA